MITVIFEAFPAKGKWENYLDIAATLRPELNKIEGFISIERFQSISNPEKVLSLSFWENEESVAKWRNMELHRAAQTAGRKSIFDDYRIRIAEVVRDYGLSNREQAPADSRLIHN
ncbi:MAG TPA: antibiotic biosynthesis monooxygenase [Bacteroidales bacterium]|nr:antibiotic biosynthesis monooxygenase [Bacteroidales bacterium]